jgi:hypothetical protein
MMQERVENRKVKVISKDKVEVIYRDCVIKYFECACGMPDHTLRFNLDDDREYIDLYAEVFLSQQPFWNRVWLAIKYVLGIEKRSGHYGTWLMKEDDCQEVIELLERYLQSDRKKN